MDLKSWSIQRDGYIADLNDGELQLDSASHTFIAEKSQMAIFSEGGP